YKTPIYLTANAVIPPLGTLSGVPKVQTTEQIYFTLVLPAGPKPSHGWPVAIYGIGAGEGKDFADTDVTGSLADHGIATIIINPFGYGWGPASTVEIDKKDGSKITIPANGRGRDLNGDGHIDNGEGSVAAGANEPGDRDSRRQTVVDWMQLVREIQ